MTICKNDIYFFTFQELIEHITGESVNPYDDINTFDNVFGSGGVNVNKSKLPNIWKESGGSYTLNPYIDQFWTELYSRYYDHYIVSGFDQDIERSDYHKFIYRLLNRLSLIYPRYSNIMKIYEDNKNKLLDRVKNVNLLTHNDTPQNGGDYAGDPFISSITKSESESDISPLIDRIKDIEGAYSDVMSNMLDEFDGLFLEDSNI